MDRKPTTKWCAVATDALESLEIGEWPILPSPLQICLPLKGAGSQQQEAGIKPSVDLPRVFAHIPVVPKGLPELPSIVREGTKVETSRMDPIPTARPQSDHFVLL